MRRLTLYLILAAMLPVVSCSKSEDPSPEPGTKAGILYYSAADQLIRFDFKSQTETAIFSGGHHYTISPAAEKFAWYQNNYGEQTTRVQVHELGSPSDYQPVVLDYILESTPQFAPGAALLGALAGSSDEPGLRNDLLLFNYQGEITGLVPHVKDFSFTPDGKDLLISAEALNAGNEVVGYALALIKNYRTDAQQSVVIHEFADYSQLPSDMAVSPNSAHVAYTHIDHLYTLHLTEGADPRQVTKSRFKELDAGWSPDGEYLVFTANSAGSADCGEIRIVPAHPAEPLPVPDDAYDNNPADPLQPVDINGKVIHSCGSEGVFWIGE